MLNGIIPVIFRCCASDFKFYELNLVQEIEHTFVSLTVFNSIAKLASFEIFFNFKEYLEEDE